jgi:hypothetical protein
MPMAIGSRTADVLKYFGWCSKELFCQYIDGYCGGFYINQKSLRFQPFAEWLGLKFDEDLYPIKLLIIG